MNKNLTDKIKFSVRDIVSLLVAREYSTLERLTGGQRLKANHIQSGVEDYGRTLVMPPEDAFEKLDIVQVEGAATAEFSIRLNLYTKEEGRSDLSIELTAFDDRHFGNRMRIQIDGILVF